RIWRRARKVYGSDRPNLQAAAAHIDSRRVLALADQVWHSGVLCAQAGRHANLPAAAHGRARRWRLRNNSSSRYGRTIEPAFHGEDKAIRISGAFRLSRREAGEPGHVHLA